MNSSSKPSKELSTSKKNLQRLEYENHLREMMLSLILPLQTKLAEQKEF
jgi:hypothetical protein